MNKILSNRAVLTIGIAESVSGLGSWITVMAIFALIVFHNDGTIAQSGGIYLAFFIPMLFFSPIAGKLADRFDRKKLMIASELLAALVVTMMVFTSRIELIYVFLALQSAAGSLMSPCRQAAIPSLVERDDLTRTNAFLQQLSGIIKIVGPLIAGALLLVIDPHMAMVLDVLSYVLSALILSRLPALLPAAVKQAEPTETETTDVTDEPVDTSTTLMGTLRTSPPLVLLFVSMFLGIVVIMSFDVLISVFTRDVLQSDETFFSIMVGVVGFGTLAAAAGLMLRKRKVNPWRDVITGLVLLGSLPLVMALASWVSDLNVARGIVVVGGILGGLGGGFANVQISTLLQQLSPPAVLGRISGAFQATIILGQLIAILATPLIVPNVLPMDTYFMLSTAGIMLVVVGATMVLRQQGAWQQPQPATVPIGIAEAELS